MYLWWRICNLGTYWRWNLDIWTPRKPMIADSPFFYLSYPLNPSYQIQIIIINLILLDFLFRHDGGGWFKFLRKTFFGSWWTKYFLRRSLSRPSQIEAHQINFKLNRIKFSKKLRSVTIITITLNWNLE